MTSYTAESQKIYLFITCAVFLCGAIVFMSSQAHAASDNANGGVGSPIAQSVRPELRGYSARVCNPSGKFGEADCHARVVTDKRGDPQAGGTPSGLGPTQFSAAYTGGASAPAGQIIAIVDAYDHPNIQNDLNTYSQAFGINPLPSCSGPIATATNKPCFQKISQTGSTTRFPSSNAGWALEIALDVEVAHATCQDCSILLVEANTNSYANLMTAVDRAIASGADVVSNSYGSGEFSGEVSYDSHFNKGLPITFSSGDSGYGVSYPAASPYVTAVGGTTLKLNSDGTYATETAWSGAGSGCSSFETQPSWQSDLNLTGCSRRMVADVSAVADPSTGAAVYDSVRYAGRKGWFVVGGTSLSAPLVAAVYALAGDGALAPKAYVNPGSLHDVLTGSNGSCGGSYLCTALAGYDGPTGMGTPNGLGAF